MKSNHSASLPGALARTVLASLRNGIASGRWRGMLPGEHKLCEELMVSRTTLRKALAQLHREGVLTDCGRGRRHRLMDDLGLDEPDTTLPNEPAEIGLIIRAREYPLVSAVGAAIGFLGQDLEAAGHSMTVHRIPVHLDAGKYTKLLTRIVADSPAKAWVLLGCPLSVQRWFVESELPAVVMGPVYDGLALPCVTIANHEIGIHLAKELNRLGHRRVVVLQPDCLMLSFEHFANGLRENLDLSAPLSSLKVETHGDSAEAVRKCITKALASKLKPTAFVVSDPVHALATVTTILMHGLRIPQDVAVVARMSDPVLDLIQPRVSTYRFDGVKLGRSVAGMVLSLIRKGSVGRKHRQILPERVRGETLGPAANAECA